MSRFQRDDKDKSKCLSEVLKKVEFHLRLDNWDGELDQTLGADLTNLYHVFLTDVPLFNPVQSNPNPTPSPPSLSGASLVCFLKLRPAI